MQRNLDKKRIFYITITLIIAILIYYASTIESPSQPETSNFSYIYHFAVFFMFAFFLLLSIKKEKLDFKTIFIALLISISYSFLDEIHQLFVLGRFASIKDVLIDGAGSICGVILIRLIENFNKKKLQQIRKKY
jgi:VanZ family protein